MHACTIHIYIWRSVHLQISLWREVLLYPCGMHIPTEIRIFICIYIYVHSGRDMILHLYICRCEHRYVNTDLHVHIFFLFVDVRISRCKFVHEYTHEKRHGSLSIHICVTWVYLFSGLFGLYRSLVWVYFPRKETYIYHAGDPSETRISFHYKRDLCISKDTNKRDFYIYEATGNTCR